MIYLLFPTPAEFEPLSLLMSSPDAVMLGRRYGVSGRLAGREVTAVVSGVGQANTAMTLAALLEKGDAELVVLGGCAGAYPGSGLGIGDVAVATREVYAELGVEAPGGWKPLSDIGLPLLDIDGARYYETFDLPVLYPPPSRGEGRVGVNINPPLLPGEGVGGEGFPLVGGEGFPLVGGAGVPTGFMGFVPSSPSPPGGEGGRGAGGVSSTLPLPSVPSREGRGGYMAGMGPGFKVISGPFLTVSTISGTAARGAELFARYGALCENMEGAAAAQVAALYGVPFVEVRGISNMVEDRNRNAWDIPSATANCAVVIERIVGSI
ncbi:MAG: hypothetical protein HZA22_01640 [Nitrospirae bacterium]|nr:hypothetical protein [Nitrospirota bacterium]